MSEYTTVVEEKLQTVWWHIGRFLHSFAILESSLNSLFEELFNLNATFYLLLVPQLDFSKRIELIMLALRRKGVNILGLTENISKFVEIRNIVAHSGFGPDEDSNGNAGVAFDYASRNGKTAFSTRVRETVRGSSDSSFISYEAFDDLDRRMKQITSRLYELAGASIPLTDKDLDEATIARMRAVLNRNIVPLTFGQEN